MFVLCVCLGLTQKLKDLILVGHAGRYPNPVNLVTVLFQMFIVLFKLLWALVHITYGLNKCNAVLLCLAEMQKSLQENHYTWGSCYWHLEMSFLVELWRLGGFSRVLLSFKGCLI